MKDWREDYVICEHVAADGNIEARHRGFRVCCPTCCDAGFLTVDDLVIDKQGALAIGKIDPDLKADSILAKRS